MPKLWLAWLVAWAGGLTAVILMQQSTWGGIADFARDDTRRPLLVGLIVAIAALVAVFLRSVFGMLSSGLLAIVGALAAVLGALFILLPNLSPPTISGVEVRNFAIEHGETLHEYSTHFPVEDTLLSEARWATWPSMNIDRYASCEFLKPDAVIKVKNRQVAVCHPRLVKTRELRDLPSCPPSEPFALIKDVDHSLVACHPSIANARNMRNAMDPRHHVPGAVVYFDSEVKGRANEVIGLRWTLFDAKTKRRVKTDESIDPLCLYRTAVGECLGQTPSLKDSDQASFEFWIDTAQAPKNVDCFFIRVNAELEGSRLTIHDSPNFASETASAAATAECEKSST